MTKTYQETVTIGSIEHEIERKLYNALLVREIEADRARMKVLMEKRKGLALQTDYFKSDTCSSPPNIVSFVYMPLNSNPPSTPGLFFAAELCKFLRSSRI